MLLPALYQSLIRHALANYAAREVRFETNQTNQFSPGKSMEVTDL
jgi:hypothetical protein